MNQQFLDKHLDAILRASGSALRHFSFEKTKQDMRAALQAALDEAFVPPEGQVRLTLEGADDLPLLHKLEGVMGLFGYERLGGGCTGPGWRFFGDYRKDPRLASTKRITKVCAKCESEDVKADARAVWDVDLQDWVVAVVFDEGHVCEPCGGECELEDKEI